MDAEAGYEDAIVVGEFTCADEIVVDDVIASGYVLSIVYAGRGGRRGCVCGYRGCLCVFDASG